MSDLRPIGIEAKFDKVKTENPGTLVLIRVGDFFESFGPDAVVIANTLELTVTQRKTQGAKLPMVGFPAHSSESYIEKLVKSGHRVTVCEQVENKESTMKSIHEWLSENDARLYIDKVTLGAARKEFNEQSSSKISAKKFREAVDENCEWFKHARRKPIHPTGLLNDRGWIRVKSAVTELLVEIQGRPLTHAVEMVRSRVSCSPSILMGLPKRLHVWR